MNTALARDHLVRLLFRRGIHDQAVLRAMAEVPREAFLPPELAEFAYEDTPLPIEEGQTISQPFIVALMAQAAGIEPGDRVLEVGTGSGYGAAVLSRIAREVYSIERHRSLAELAARRLRELGYDNVHVVHGDGTRGWAEQAPFDAILVTAGGPDSPEALKGQLGHKGRLVIPVGETPRAQQLLCLERTNGRIRQIDLGAVRFVPLIGEEGWTREGEPNTASLAPSPPRGEAAAVSLMREALQPITTIDYADLGSLVERIGTARVVLLGEATHGTSQFYRMRARITRELVAHHGFGAVAIEGDWPDAAWVNRWALGQDPGHDWTPFARFPTWMWRNPETAEFLWWLRGWNSEREEEDRAGFYGLDLYSMHRSIAEVLDYLEGVDPDAAKVAAERYGCLTPWQHDPAVYGRVALSGRHRLCEPEVVAMLQHLLTRRLEYMRKDGESFLDAVQNARLVADAERYYRVMYAGGHASWNLRDQHMFDTLLTLLDWRGPASKAVVWAHNSHVGDSNATEMGAAGQLTIGGLARDHLGAAAFSVGFGTDRGTVAAANDWGGPMEWRSLRPSRPGSYEALSHATGAPGFLLHLREPSREGVREELAPARLERAVGVVYRAETELESHYFQASFPSQFDAWIWFDVTSAVSSLPSPIHAHAPVP